MEEKEKILVAQNWIRQLANGINPINGREVKEDDVVNNVHISRCLFYVAELLGQLPEKKTKPRTQRVVPFSAASLQRVKYNYVDIISISAFAREITNLIPEDMQTVNYKSFTTWLIQNGFLTESEPDREGRRFKFPTEKGKNIGISVDQRERTGGGSYTITLYNRQAQQYLLDHIEEISLVQ